MHHWRGGAAEFLSRPSLHGDRRGDDETPMLDKKQRQSGCARLSAQTVSAIDDHYGALFRGSRNAVLVTDRTGRCIEANPAAETLLGFGRDELLQLHLSEIVGGGIASSEAQGSQSQFLTVDRMCGEIEVRGKDGFLRRVEAWSMELSAPLGAAYALFLRGASERSGTEEAGARLFAIVASSTEAIIGTTLDGTITHWNPAAERVY